MQQTIPESCVWVQTTPPKGATKAVSAIMADLDRLRAITESKGQGSGVKALR